MRKETLNIERKTVEVYISTKTDAPIVYSCDFSKNADDVLSACNKIGCPEFHLVSMTGIYWDEEMSPWAHEPVVAKNDHFTGEADNFLKMMETEIVPQVQKLIPDSQISILNGYSMGGLFALFTAYRSDLFDAYAAPSGSVWYPEFVDFVREHQFKKMPKAIYLSIGDKESRTRNKYLSHTESNMKELQLIYKDRGVATAFELNEGNHFKDVNHRIAKGLKWVLTTLEEQKGI